MNETVLMSTHNLCFGSKIRKNIYPCIPKFYYIKVEFWGDIFYGHVFMLQLIEQNHKKIYISLCNSFLLTNSTTCILSQLISYKQKSEGPLV